MPDVDAKSQTYSIKERKTGNGCSVQGYPTADPNQVRSSVPDGERHYDRGGCGSPAMKRAKKFGRMK